ncbi:nucleoside monophosphate kinase [Candidatus Pacearchaeota archaeon]|nr:nucleoside monophosphate kinase [Candidatus Pacearchaeota archaeon]
MKLIFLGIQGSGKGTQAKVISEKLKICHISTGDLLRNAPANLKQKIDSYVNSGKLVPDELIIEILKTKLNNEDCKNGFILDGFPRNLNQALELDKIIKIDKVIEIAISDNEALKRLTGRWNCKKCNLIYNVNTSPKPKVAGKCDVCYSGLYQREDDKEEAIKKRIETYHKETFPLIRYYNAMDNSVNPSPSSQNYPDRKFCRESDSIKRIFYIKINGEQEIEKVTEDIFKDIFN